MLPPPPLQAGEACTHELADIMLTALLAGEDRLTRCAQDERDIEALHKMRAAIRSVQETRAKGLS